MCILPSFAQAADAVPHWQILPDKSSVEWTVNYGGKPLKGSFPDFTADIAFDVAHLDVSKVFVKIAMAKVKSDDKDAQENLPTKEWFAAVDYPVAVFEANTFTHSKDDNYEAKGTLSLHGKSVKITLPFMAKFYDDGAVHYARIDGETTLKRLDFGVGQGDWAKTDAVADEVKVAIHIEARQVP